METLVTNFGALDWVIVAAYLAGTVAIGVYANRFIRDMSDYVVAGRSLKSYLGIATMIGSELGLVTVMYSAQKGFTGGLAAFHIGVVAGLVTLLVGLTGFIVVPLRRLKVMTIPEFYELRFSRGVRIMGGLLLAVGGILNMGLFLKAGALFVSGLTGLVDPLAVKLIMTALIVLVVAYTMLGGMVSVVLTDYVQFVVLSFGLLFACALAVGEVGWDRAVSVVQTVHGEAGFNPLAQGAGFGPSYVVWMIFTAGLVSCAVWQTAVMRACSAESTSVVKRLYVWSSVGFMIRFLIPQFLGVCALAFFWQHPDAHSFFFDGQGQPVVDHSLQAMPAFLGQILPAGLIGLIGAGMLAAFMSTHDSYLLCWASVLTEDVVNPLAKGRLTTRVRLALARSLIVVLAAFLLIWSLWYQLEQDLWDYMAVTGAVYFTGAFALLLGGLYWKRASTTGAYLALGAGALAVIGLKPVQALLGLTPENIGFQLTSETVGLSVVTLALTGMLLGSLLFPDPQRGGGDPGRRP